MDVGELAPRHGFRSYGSALCFKVQCSGLASSATTQSHILVLELVYHNIYPIYELLALVKELVLHNDNCRISLAWGNIRISEGSFSESNNDGVPEAIGQRPWTRLMIHCNEHLWEELTKGLTALHTRAPNATRKTGRGAGEAGKSKETGWFFFNYFFLGFILGAWCRGEGQIWRE